MLGTADGDSNILIGRFSANNNSGALKFVKSRDPVIFDGTFSKLGGTDTVGSIEFYADDGTDLVSMPAQIRVDIDGGTVWTNDTPGVLKFLTAADGANTVTEALRLDSSQNATFAGSISIPAADKLYLDGGSDTYIYEESADDLHCGCGWRGDLQIDQALNSVGIGNSPSAGVPQVTLRS
jgi:hypothetical protein